MTLQSRHLLYLLFIVTAVLMFVATLVLVFTIQYGSSALESFQNSGMGSYLVFTWNLQGSEPLLVSLNTFLGLILALGTLAIIYHYFRRHNSPILFFLALFAVSLTFESSRFFAMWLVAENGSSHLRLIATRTHIFGHMLGALGLLSASLHLAGLGSKHQGILALLSFVAAATLATYLPIDGVTPIQGYLWDTSYYGVELITLVIAGVSLLNVVKFGFDEEGGGNVSTVLEFLMLLIGHQFTLWAGSLPVILLAWLLMGGAMVLLIRNFVRTYLWY